MIWLVGLTPNLNITRLTICILGLGAAYGVKAEMKQGLDLLWGNPKHGHGGLAHQRLRRRHSDSRVNTAFLGENTMVESFEGLISIFGGRFRVRPRVPSYFQWFRCACVAMECAQSSSL